MPDKTVIVTGASRGLGEAIVRQLIKYDANIVMVARDAGRLQTLANSLWRAVPVAGDVTNEADCQRVIDTTLERFDKIDAIINNAGIIEPLDTLENADIAGWAKVYEVNVLGVLQLTKLALPHLFKQAGRIINISSKATYSLKPGFGAYSTSKAALNHLTQMLALEHPVVVSTAVGPGAIDTEMQAVIERETTNRNDIIGKFFAERPPRELPSPEAPAQAIATLALYAQHDLQGQFVMWDDERVQAWVKKYAPQK